MTDPCRRPRHPTKQGRTASFDPIVFGANDGLVSNLALVMGVAGATSDNAIIVPLAGVAGLIAGAFSMGVGEYVSVQSQRELLDYPAGLPAQATPRGPRPGAGDPGQAVRGAWLRPRGGGSVRKRCLRRLDHAVRLLIFEEVGLDARSIGSPLAAAAGSFVAFTTGAIIPLVPYLLGAGMHPAFVASLLVSLGALAFLGAGIAALTRRPAWYGALRQVCLGAVAAGFTYAVGLVVGSAPVEAMSRFES